MDVDSFEPLSFDEVPDPHEGWMDMISIAGTEGASSAASSVTRSLARSATGPSDVTPSTEDMGRALFDAHSSVARLSQPIGYHGNLAFSGGSSVMGPVLSRCLSMLQSYHL